MKTSIFMSDKKVKNLQVGLRLSTLAIGAPPGLDCAFVQLISPISDPPVINGVMGRGSPVTRGEIGR